MKIFSVNGQQLRREVTYNDFLYGVVYDWYMERRPKVGFSQANFVRLSGLSASFFQGLIRCEVSPKDKKGRYKSEVKKIARKLKRSCAELFPDHLYKHLEKPFGRNTLLESKIQETGVSFRVFAESIGLTPSRLSGFITLRLSPFGKSGEYLECCEQIAHPLGCSLGELFPPSLYQVSFVEEVDILDIDSPDCTQDSVFHAQENPLDQAIRNEMVCMLGDFVSSMPWSQREVLELRWGLFGGEQYTIEQIGRILKMSFMKVRTIEAKGLAALQLLGG